MKPITQRTNHWTKNAIQFVEINGGRDQEKP